MQIEQTVSKGLKRELKVTIPASDMETKVNERLVEISQNARIPGFRPGKAPMTVLKTHYGDSILGEVLDKTIANSSAEVMKDKGFRPASRPHIEITSYDKGKDLEYTIKLELMPEIEDLDVKKLKLTKYTTKADDKEVDDILKTMADSKQVAVPLKKERKTKDGDSITLDFKGFVDGEAFTGGEAQDYSLVLGSGSFIPGFEDQLVGMEIGQEGEVNVAFPKEYPAKDLAGKDALFEVKIKGIQEMQPAKVDDELAKLMGFESLDKLRLMVVEDIGKRYEQASKTKLKADLFEHIKDSFSFELPESLMEEEMEIQRQRDHHDHDHDSETGECQHDKKKKLSKKDEELITKNVADRLRVSLVLAETARKNNVTVQEEDIRKAIVAEARQYPGQEQQVFEYFSKNQEAVAHIRGQILEEKVVDFVIELAKPKDKNVKADELLELAGMKPIIEGDDSKAKSTPKKTAKKKAAEKKSEDKKTESKKASAKAAAPKKTAAKKEPAKKAAPKKTTAKKAPAKKTAAK